MSKIKIQFIKETQKEIPSDWFTILTIAARKIATGIEISGFDPSENLKVAEADFPKAIQELKDELEAK